MTSRYGSIGSQAFIEPKGLNNLGELYNVLDELNIAENSLQWNTLLDHRRELHSTMDSPVKLNSTEAKSKQCKLYFFNDMLIIGQYKKSKRKKTIHTVGTQEDFVFGDLIGREGSEVDEPIMDDELSLGGGTTLSKRSISRKPSNKSARSKGRGSVRSVRSAMDTPKLKVKLWLDLENVDLRKVDEKGEFGVKCSCTISEKIQDEETGEVQFSTEIQQVVFFVPDKEDRQRIYSQLQNTVDNILESKIRAGSKFGDDFRTIGDSMSMTDGGSVIAETDDGTGTLRSEHIKRLTSTLRSKSQLSVTSTGSKKRSYAKAKETMRKQRYIKNKKKTGTFTSEVFQALTLDDLQARYDLLKSDADKEKNREFLVTFPQGPMGLALSSVKGSEGGVFVGKLEKGGMAEVGGVTLGDRVVKIGKVAIGDGMTWTDAIKVIKTEREGLNEDGKPKKLVIKFSRSKVVEDNVAKKLEEAKIKKIRDRIKRRGGKRAWTKRKAKSFGSRMSSLKDLKSRYDKTRDKNEQNQELCDELFEYLLSDETKGKTERGLIFLLKEMFDTERAYLSQLYHLIDNYMKPLSKKKNHDQAALLSPKQSKAIFGNVQILVQVNESLMKGLQDALLKLSKRVKEGDKEVSVIDVVIGFSPVFTNTMPYFRMYSTYAYQYSNALETLNKLKENETFKEELNKLEQKQMDKKGDSLNSLLMKPISRLCKYPLLFANLNDNCKAFITSLAEEAVKNGTGDVDKLDRCLSALLSASKVVADIAQSVDVKVGTSQDLEKLYEIYLELGGHKGVEQFMQPSRRFIGKFKTLIDEKKKGSKPKPIWLYLFSDLVIMAAPKQDRFFFRKATINTMESRGSFETGKSTASKSKSRFSKTRRKNDKAPTNMVVVKRQVKIDCVTVRKNFVQNKDGLFGLSFTETKRKVSLVKTTRRERRKKSTVKEETQETDVVLVDLWCETEKERDEILAKIGGQIKEYKKNKRAKKRINQKLKPELRKRQRQWKSKARKLRQESMKKLSENPEMMEVPLPGNSPELKGDGAVEPVDEV